MRLRVGFLVSTDSYDRILKLISPKVVFIPKSVKQEEYERLWFVLGSDSLVLCIDKCGFNYAPYITSRNVLDLKEMSFKEFEVEEARSYFYQRIYSLYEIIKACNELRNSISSTYEEFEWCGSEKESLVNENIILHSKRITGLKCNGYYYTGLETCNDVICKRDDFVGSLYDSLAKKDLDEGQKKLFSNFAGFAMNNDIVYIGCCPGEGWNEAISALNWKGKVYCFDINDANHNYKNAFHKSLKITSWEDVSKNLPPGKYDFIWDVRADEKGDFSTVISHIMDEIMLVNDILRNIDFRRCMIKINIRLAHNYMYRDDVRFFIQPFTLGRIREVRAVFNNVGEERFWNQNLSDCLNVFYDNCSYVDEDLFSNAFSMRYDISDYCVKDAEVGLHRIILFSANCNSKDKLLNLLRDNNHVTVSYFLCEDDFKIGETDFPITGFLEAGYRCLDSRFFGVPKIEGLYFMSNFPFSNQLDESKMSESNVIKSVMDVIVQSGKHSDYLRLKHMIPRNAGCVFPKFPEPYSQIDKLVSPSGHICRIAIGHQLGVCNLAQFFFKVVRNLKGEFSPDDKYMELTPINLWHSKKEWMFGLDIAKDWLGEGIKEELINLIDYIKKEISSIPNDKHGIEIFILKKKNGSINANFNCDKFIVKNKLLPGTFDHIRFKEIFKDEFNLVNGDLKKFVNWISTYKNSDKWKYLVNCRLDAHLRELFFHYELDCLKHSKVWILNDLARIVIDGMDNGWILSNEKFKGWLENNFNVHSDFPFWNDFFYEIPKSKVFKVLSERFPLLYVNISELRKEFTFRRIV